MWSLATRACAERLIMLLQVRSELEILTKSFIRLDDIEKYREALSKVEDLVLLESSRLVNFLTQEER